MRTDANQAIRESLTSKSFRALSTSRDQSQLEFTGSGFESLAAHKSPGHTSVLGFFVPATHHLCTTFPDLRTELIRRRSPHLFPPKTLTACSAFI